MAPSTATKPLSAVSTPLDVNQLANYAALKPIMSGNRNPKRESVRITTFRNWPVDFLSPKNLAKNGFYYTCKSDIVRCAFCGVEIGYWEEGDDPVSDHVIWSPNCDFINGRDCGNVPLGELSSQQQQQQQEEEEGGGGGGGGGGGREQESEPEGESAGPLHSYDTCGPFANEIRPFSGPERVPHLINTKALWKDLEHLGVSEARGPTNPRYSTYESRIKTFETWPADKGIRPEALAEAGFYYLQYHDNTMCFHCGGGLKNWEIDDDPWVEHARWFDKCGFINMRKGKEFVNEVLAKNKAVLPAKAVLDLCKGNQISGSSDPGDKAKACNENASASEGKAPVASSSASSPCSSTRELELCRICYMREREIVFLPCGHFVSCITCAPSLSKCAVCRKPYEATVRAYLS